MRRALIALGLAALAVFAGSLVLVTTHQAPTPANELHAVSAVADDETSAALAPQPRPTPRAVQPKAALAPPPGFTLGTRSGPDARAKAQAILDDALSELRRLDASQPTLARDVYMRGHSAAERVEDELEADDEPGLLELRALERAMKAELRRIYGADEPTPRP